MTIKKPITLMGNSVLMKNQSHMLYHKKCMVVIKENSKFELETKTRSHSKHFFSEEDRIRGYSLWSGGGSESEKN